MGAMLSIAEMAHSVIRGMDPMKRIETLEPAAQDSFRALLFLVANHGYARVRVLSGRRSLPEQYAIFGQGRRTMELHQQEVPAEYAQPDARMVSWVRPKDSKHVRGLAVDLDFSMYKGVTWYMIGRIAETCGLTWGGDWKVKDFGHFEI